MRKVYWRRLRQPKDRPHWRGRTDAPGDRDDGVLAATVASSTGGLASDGYVIRGTGPLHPAVVGLVREVSVVNALFFNTAAFIGVGVGWYPRSTRWRSSGSAWSARSRRTACAAILIGLACVILALIFASLTTVMPRSGGDYVFTSRIVPRIGPFLGWLESWTLAFASIAIIAFEVPVFIRNLQITGRIIGIGTASSFFNNANGWFTDESGAVTGVPGLHRGGPRPRPDRARHVPADPPLPPHRDRRWRSSGSSAWS